MLFYANLCTDEESLQFISDLFLQAILIVFNINGTTHCGPTNRPATLLTTSNSIGEVSFSHRSSLFSPIDVPLPLRGVSEQILYRKAYVVSYNKDYRIPNWVAWHLTSEHAYGDIKRPQNANLNSGTWNPIEISCRRWAEMYGG